ncbi:MAG TPA: hypothetical protein VK700_13065 [Steroidobacteraceae bacterium]|jgi:hypothetical protein|nr:hypothetical protein [Steroidobacteraceae bacterium]
MRTTSSDQDQRTVEQIIREAERNDERSVPFSTPLWIAIIAVAMFAVGVGLLLYFGE